MPDRLLRQQGDARGGVVRAQDRQTGRPEVRDRITACAGVPVLRRVELAAQCLRQRQVGARGALEVAVTLAEPALAGYVARDCAALPVVAPRGAAASPVTRPARRTDLEHARRVRLNGA